MVTLQLPQGTLDSPANNQPDRVTLRSAPFADCSGQAVQEGNQRHGGDLEAAVGAEKSFRRLSAPELLREVHLGVVFVDGVRKSKDEATPKAAA